MALINIKVLFAVRRVSNSKNDLGIDAIQKATDDFLLVFH